MILVAQKDGQRLDAAVAELAEGLSRSAVQKLLEDGLVTVNGRPVKKNYKTAAGDEIALTLPQVQETELVPEDIPLDNENVSELRNIGHMKLKKDMELCVQKK